MSNDIMNRIWWREDFDDLLATLNEKDKLPGSGRALKWVLISLADNASDPGYCWPSIETIAQRTCLTERSVQRAIKQALALKLLRRRLRTNNSSEYLFNLDLLPHGTLRTAKKNTDPFASFDEEPDLFEGVTSVQKKRVDPKAGVTSVQAGVTSVQARGDTVAPKPSIEPSKEPLVKEGVETTRAITISLRDFIQAEWEKLKADYPNVGACRAVLDSQVDIAVERAGQHRKPGQTDIDVWTDVFAEVRKSRFLTGQCPPGPGRTSRFRLTLSKLLKTHIFREVINEGYSDIDADNGNFDPNTGEILGPAKQATDRTFERIRQARERGGFGGD